MHVLNAIMPPQGKSWGGGGTQIWFGQGFATRTSKPLPIFKGHFAGKRVPIFRILIKI